MIVSAINFAGVVNTKPPNSLNANELVNCTNFYVTPYGSLKARRGLSLLGSLPSADFRSICYFSKTNLLYLASGTTLYSFDPASGRFTVIGNVDTPECSFIEAFGKLWIADGGKLKYYDGTTFGTVDDFIYKTQTIGTGDGTTTSFTGTLATPVTPSSVSVSYTVGSTTYTAVDDGKGNITGDYISTGTVNYQTGSISLTFSTAPANGTQINVKYSNSEVINVFADDIAFKDERIYVAYGSDIYISLVRDPSAWFFISVNKQDGAKIKGIHVYYDKLVIFKGDPKPAIYILSGYNLQTYTLSRVAQHVSVNNKYSVRPFLGDLYFNWGRSVYALSKLLGYGEVEPVPLTLHFDTYDTTSQERFALPLPGEYVIFFLSRSDALPFAFTPERNACTFLNFAVPCVCGVVVGTDVYLAGGGGVFKFAPINTDAGINIAYSVDFAHIGNYINNTLVKRIAIRVLPFMDGDLSVFVKGKRVLFTQITPPSVWDRALWDSARYGTDTNTPIYKRQVIFGRTLDFTMRTGTPLELFAFEIDMEVKHG
ncbi:hypothetical protein Hydth_0550 [Hydrogenobacter thermophilus TK-6]|uniref:Uncharacterized protein n=1 Tax=Hydrogenobacter thermophilus (strain DSM 6534 / IAM 12695 / TK-6) TaxID=608538 RepID=D3DGR2_HYDTT|nr:hypothetical protein [Hydrogenobacter thermophilus]ADO44950.1 hypothetical protein Hydth_0550 [Hydrogenobacter thermophilus TK-6]BAI69014.1 hypothetical protein HTH_0552 [Hydrogenobacter thermophilus TK-6]